MSSKNKAGSFQHKQVTQDCIISAKAPEAMRDSFD